MRLLLGVLIGGCVGPRLPEPVLLVDNADIATLGADGRYVWVTHEGDDYTLRAGTPDLAPQVLDHALFPAEHGRSFVIAGPDTIVWGQRGAFSTCGAIRLVDAAGPRQLADQDLSLCKAFPVDQFHGSVAVATESTTGDGVDVVRISVATGLRTPWFTARGGIYDAQIYDDRLFLVIGQTNGAYLASTKRASDHAPLAFESAVRPSAYTLRHGAVVQLDNGVGDDPAQILAQDGSVIADLGKVKPVGLYATSDGLWTVLDDSILNIGDDAVVTSYATSVPEQPVALLGEQLLVRDMSSYPDNYAALYLQALGTL